MLFLTKLIAAVRRYITAAVAVVIVSAAAKDVAQVKIAVQNIQQDYSQNNDPGFVFVFTAGHDKASLKNIITLSYEIRRRSVPIRIRIKRRVATNSKIV